MTPVPVHLAEGPALDWLVAKARKVRARINNNRIQVAPRMPKVDEVWQFFMPTTDWRHGGPLAERKKISAIYHNDSPPNQAWWATRGDVRDDETLGCTGPTELVAKMRAYVISELGEVANVPKELIAVPSHVAESLTSKIDQG